MNVNFINITHIYALLHQRVGITDHTHMLNATTKEFLPLFYFVCLRNKVKHNCPK